MDLKECIDTLNARIEEYNQAIRNAERMAEITKEKAAFLLLPEGCVTVELVRNPHRWSRVLKRAVGEMVVNETPQEIIRLCEFCKVNAEDFKTESIKWLYIGSLRSPGMLEGELYAYPVAIRIIDYAHLLAHAGASPAILLG